MAGYSEAMVRSSSIPEVSLFVMICHNCAMAFAHEFVFGQHSLLFDLSEIDFVLVLVYIWLSLSCFFFLSLYRFKFNSLDLILLCFITCGISKLVLKYFSPKCCITSLIPIQIEYSVKTLNSLCNSCIHSLLHMVL